MNDCFPLKSYPCFMVDIDALLNEKLGRLDLERVYGEHEEIPVERFGHCVPTLCRYKNDHVMRLTHQSQHALRVTANGILKVCSWRPDA